MLLPFQDVSLAILVPLSESGGVISIISGVTVSFGGAAIVTEVESRPK